MVTSHQADARADAAANAGDLGPLAWVLDETRKSIESASKSLKRFAHESEAARGVDMASVDASQLRLARQQLHQAVGALEMVGQPVAAQVVRGMEAAVQQLVLRPEKCGESAVATLERAGFALVDYLENQLNARGRSALGLFPQFRQVQEMAGADRVHPADLWDGVWRWSDPAMPAPSHPLAYGAEVRARMDQRVLKIMRHADTNAAAELTVISQGLAAAEEARQPAIFWKLCAGFFQALAQKLVPMDIYAKRASSRVLLQYAALARGEKAVSERLALDLLFFCAQARAFTDSVAPVLAAVRRAWGLSRHVPVDYEQPAFGLYDPAVLAQARRRVEAVKENWSALAGGDLARLKACVSQFGLVTESLDKLHERGKPLSDALGRVAAQVGQSGRAPSPELAMETATAVLFLEASFADFQPGDAQFTSRMQQLADRLDSVRGGASAPALEPWMEELYRSVSDRQTMGTVVGELRTTLGEVEQHLDQFFRNPADKSTLTPVPARMSQMRGVLSVLGLDQAALAVGRMSEALDDLLTSEASPEDIQASGTFDRIGNSLGALGFQIDMMNYQPMLARKLFIYDTASGELRHVAGRAEPGDAEEEAAGAQGGIDMEFDLDLGEPQAPAQAADLLDGGLSAETLPGQLDQIATLAAIDERPALAEAANRAAEAARERDAERLSGALEELQAAARPASVAPEPAAHADDRPALDDEDDLLDIFLEEAREVVQAGRQALQALQQEPGDLEQQTTLRRAFHTLKGSSRMVGLTEFGEAAWSMEQLLNAWLAEQRPMSDDVRGLAEEAMDGFERWIGDVAGKRAGHWRAAPYREAADALRMQGQRWPLASVLAGEAPTAEAAPQGDLAQADAPLVEAVTLDEASEAPRADAAPAAAGDAAESTPSPALMNIELPDLELPAPAADPAPQVLELDLSQFEDAAPGDAAASGANVTDAEAPGSQSAIELLELDLSGRVFDDPPEQPSAAVEVADAGELSGELLAEFQPSEQPHLIEAPEAESHSEALPSDAGGEPGVEVLALDLNEFDFATNEAQGASGAERPVADDEHYKQIGDLRISTPLYNVYLNEADEWSRHLMTELSEWSLELDRPVPELAIARAHSLAGSSATVGFAALSEMARAVEHALQRLAGQPGAAAAQVQLLGDAAEDIRRVLHQFAAGMLKQPDASILAAVQAIEPVETQPAEDRPVTAAAFTPPMPVPAAAAAVTLEHRGVGEDIDVVDAVDPDLFPIFEEEAQELLPQLGAAMRQWAGRPDDRAARGEVLRALHTLKGSARLAGALRLGEMAHRTESAIELIGTEQVRAEDVEPLLDHLDELLGTFRKLQDGGVGLASVGAEQAPEPLPAAPEAPALEAQVPDAAASAEPAIGQAPLARGEVAQPAALSLVTARAAASQAVRVRSQLLDRLVSQAGEVMTSRARLEVEVGQLRSSLSDLTGNLERLRQQLRDVELQAETQMQSRLAQSKDSQQNFDPLEFDRFTRMQELTRMMAESVNDVATVQRNLQRALDASEDGLAAQARQSRELQRDLLRTRMVEFESISERLYRVVRQASKETNKQVRLDIIGGSIEMDRGILERMTPAFEHLLRNCVVHGIEGQAARTMRGKDPVGHIAIEVHQAGNDVSIEFRDDGAGLNLPRIRERALQLGLIKPEQSLTDAEVRNLVFMPGFSTATEVTELAGRGVGMDVVRTEVQSIGGRIETDSAEGQGSAFRLVLPLTTAVTHVVMVRAGSLAVGVPSSLVEIVQRVPEAGLKAAYESGIHRFGDEDVPFHWAGALLQSSARSTEPPARTTPVVIFRSASQRIAVHVDEVLGNQEVVVKALGPQLARLPGLVAMTALASGAVALIYNPVALASVYGEQARALAVQAFGAPRAPDAPVADTAAPRSDIPLVLVVDDSITVRRVTQRLLQREGYRVALAADGLQGLERLQIERPAVVLSDIEMPRMDGFDFVRNIRADTRLHDLPVIMITSRIAAKHRDHARELGVDHYLGKPYSEDELLGLIKNYVRASATSAAG
ncbi:Hpt domain-containing protein [Ottowia sp.]|uniref:hybrid sensor histidine kinase/response regulator n=1 Tax=Ottowia sp. TaxID=1898956 RepID=UPI0039E646B3